MTAAAGILLLVAGAILTFAVDASVEGIELNTVGVILMIAGGVGLLVALFQDAVWAERFRRDRAVERPPADDPRYR